MRHTRGRKDGWEEGERRREEDYFLGKLSKHYHFIPFGFFLPHLNDFAVVSPRIFLRLKIAFGSPHSKFNFQKSLLLPYNGFSYTYCWLFKCHHNYIAVCLPHFILLSCFLGCRNVMSHMLSRCLLL